MDDWFDWAARPEALWELGVCASGSLAYRREGDLEEAADWFEAINEVAGPVLPPNGVLMFVPVTRAAVHKRLKEGRLASFSFQVVSSDSDFYQRIDVDRAKPFVFVPVGACKEWAEELWLKEMEGGYDERNDEDETEDQEVEE